MIDEVVTKKEVINKLLVDAHYVMVDDWGNITPDGEIILECINELPSEHVVKQGAYDQVVWERDIAIQQLNMLGYGLGEKPRACEKCQEFDCYGCKYMENR